MAARWTIGLRLVFAVWSVGTVLWASAPCLARQNVEVDVAEPVELDEVDGGYSRRYYRDPDLAVSDVARLTKVLGLSTEQAHVITDLITGFTQRKQEAGRKISEFEQAMEQRSSWESRSDEDKQQCSDAYKRYGEYSKKIRDSLVLDIKEALDERQSGLWWRVEQWTRRRERLQGFMYASTGASGIDLIALTESAFGKEAVPETAEAALLEYEVALDRILKRHSEEDGQLDKGAAQDWERMTEEQRDESQRTWWAREHTRGRELRECNVKGAAQILMQMPEGSKRTEFEYRFYRAAGSSVYMQRPESSLPYAFGRARKLVSSDPAQLAKFEEVERSFRATELVRLKASFAEACRGEDEMTYEKSRSPEAYMNRYREEQSRNAEEKRWVDALREVLTPEQLEKMPPPVKRVAVPTLDFDE